MAKDSASIGMLVTIPTDWAARMEVKVTCPKCGAQWISAGADALTSAVRTINEHEC